MYNISNHYNMHVENSLNKHSRKIQDIPFLSIMLRMVVMNFDLTNLQRYICIKI